MKTIHFTNQKDRLDFLKGNFEEIKLPKAEPTEVILPKVEEKAEEKPKKGKKSAKKSKKEDENGKSKAE